MRIAQRVAVNHPFSPLRLFIDQFKNPNYYYNVENWLRSGKISLNQLQGVFLFGTFCRIWRYLGCAKANRKFRHKNPLNDHSTRAAEPALVRIGGKHVPCFSMLVRYRTVMHSEATLSPAPFPSGESHGSDRSNGKSDQSGCPDLLSG
jgi:hypothetical protein